MITQPNIILSPSEIEYASKRIDSYIHRTPIQTSKNLNKILGHEFFFKCENFQKTGAFKVRGALNKILSLIEGNSIPKHVVAFSSGNHSQAVAYVTSLLNIKATIFLPENVSPIKLQATKNYDATVVITKTRQDAEARAHELVGKGAVLISPFDDDMVLAGQGTAAYEALLDIKGVSAIFAPIGGGGLVSGTYLAKELISPKAKVFACEPLIANDAAISLRNNKIFSFDRPPNTIADGAKTLNIGTKILPYLKKLDGIFEIEESDIIYWTQWLTHILKISVEPTSALAMASAAQWIKSQKTKQRILIIISGGNISPKSYREIWKDDLLATNIFSN